MTQTAEPVQGLSSFHSLWKLLSCVENPRILSLRFCTSIDKDVNNQSSAAANGFQLLWGHWHAFSHLWLFHLYWTTYPNRLQQLFEIIADVVLKGRFKYWALTSIEDKSPTHERQLIYINTLQSIYLFLNAEQNLWYKFSNCSAL